MEKRELKNTGWMRDAMVEAGLPDMQFEYHEYSFYAVLIGSEAAETTQKTTQKIMDMIEENPYVTRRELAEGIGITEAGIKYHLARLKEKGLIRRVGPDKGGYWEVVKRNRQGIE